MRGTFQPTNFGAGADTFPPPAPTLDGTSLSVFDGANPNGTWPLFVVDDDRDFAPGSLTGGWSLTITAEADVQVQERVKIKKDKKERKKKGGKKGKR